MQCNSYDNYDLCIFVIEKGNLKKLPLFFYDTLTTNIILCSRHFTTKQRLSSRIIGDSVFASTPCNQLYLFSFKMIIRYLYFLFYFQDFELEQKMEFEMKMREGTTRLLAACKHQTQLLQAAKSLLTSNERMTTYIAELHRKSREPPQ